MLAYCKKLTEPRKIKKKKKKKKKKKFYELIEVFMRATEMSSSLPRFYI